MSVVVASALPIASSPRAAAAGRHPRAARLPAPLAAVVPGGTVTVGATYAGTILEARAYARALATSEVVGQHRGWLL